MVRHATDIGEIRAAADLLGHSPDMLMRVYAHALPESVRTVTDKIERRSGEFV
jgi:integrase